MWANFFFQFVGYDKSRLRPLQHSCEWWKCVSFVSRNKNKLLSYSYWVDFYYYNWKTKNREHILSVVYVANNQPPSVVKDRPNQEINGFLQRMEKVKKTQCHWPENTDKEHMKEEENISYLIDYQILNWYFILNIGSRIWQKKKKIVRDFKSQIMKKLTR